MFSAIQTKLQDESGLTLIELTSIIIILSIGVLSYMNMSSFVTSQSGQATLMMKAMQQVQEKMEEIRADKDNSDRGYSWITSQDNYDDEELDGGFTRSVEVQTAGLSHNGIPYAYLKVTVSHADMPDVGISTWLTDY